MKIEYGFEALDAVTELLQAKRSVGESQIPILTYKNAKLAYYLGKIKDVIQPEIERFNKERRTILEELGTKTVAFSSPEELLNYTPFTSSLNDSQKREHEGRFYYQMDSIKFEELHNDAWKIIDPDMFIIPNHNIEKYSCAIKELLNIDVVIDTKIPIELLMDIEYEGMVSIICKLHDIVEDK